MSAATNPAVGQLPPLFGRKWNVTVEIPDQSFTVSDSAWDPSALRVTFDIFTPALSSAYWFADIAIYNLDSEVVDKLLTQQVQNITVTISAGYQNPNSNYGIIWQGPVFQAYLERDNDAVDLKLTLWCIVILPPLLDSSGVGATYAAADTAQQQIVQSIAKLLQTKVTYLSPKLNAPALPRAKTVFGNLSQHLDSIAANNNMQWWLDATGLNFGSMSDLTGVNAEGDVTYSPPIEGVSTVTPLPPLPSGTGSIIGTPQQTMNGVSFRVLLDPRVRVQKPLMTAAINNTQLLFLKRQIGQNPKLLDQGGIYVIMAVRHVGDTRGNPWYTEIEGWTRTGATLAGLVGQQLLNGAGPRQ